MKERTPSGFVHHATCLPPASRRRRRPAAAVAATGLLAVAALLAACGSTSSSSGAKANSGTTAGSSGGGGSSTSASSASSAKTTAKFHSLLPSSIQSSGKISDASAFDYPPYAYTGSGGQYVGGEIDILDAVAPLLGVKFTYQRFTEFSALVPAVGDGRVQMASESIGVTAARRQQVSYVAYGSLGEGLLVKKGNPSGISTSDVCGYSVAVEAGAIEVQEYQELSKKCTSAGKKAIGVDVYATEPAQVLAVEDGHSDAVAVGSTTVKSIAAKSNGALEALPGMVAPFSTPIGFVFNPKETALAKAFEAAMKDLEANGTLAKINKQWDLVSSLDVRYLPAT